MYNPETNDIVKIDSEVTDVIRKPVSGASSGTQILFRVTNYKINFAGVLFGVFVRCADMNDETDQYAGNMSVNQSSASIRYDGSFYVYDADSIDENGCLYKKDYTNSAAIHFIKGNNDLYSRWNVSVTIDTLYGFVD